MGKRLPLEPVEGNTSVDSNSESILFRGLSISDSDRTEYQGHCPKVLG